MISQGNQDGRNHRVILIVDDNGDLADGLADVLELDGHDVLVAYGGEDAIQRFRERPIDLTLLDVKLPGIDGFEVFSELRRADAETRIVMMTGYRIDELLSRAVDDGALEILREPVAMTDVLAAVASVGGDGIVLVETAPSFAGSVVERLEMQGQRVLWVEDPRGITPQAVESETDILVVDLRRPLVESLRVYLEFKRLGRTMPAILITGQVSSGDAVDFLRSVPVTGCLLKPFEMPAVLDILCDLAREGTVNDGDS